MFQEKTSFSKEIYMCVYIYLKVRNELNDCRKLVQTYWILFDIVAASHLAFHYDMLHWFFLFLFKIIIPTLIMVKW